jgi:hypothetical protein
MTVGLKRIVVALWSALVAVLVADPSLAVAIGRKGNTYWNWLRARSH